MEFERYDNTFDDNHTPVMEDDGNYQGQSTPHQKTQGGNMQYGRPSYPQQQSSKQTTEEYAHSTSLPENTSVASIGQPFSHVRIINKDTIGDFEGVSPEQPSSSMGIHLFGNRKSQLLGFCLFMAMLGVTIALHDEYRWAGLAAGSTLTLITGSAVVYTYHNKRQWHQHPNPIVHTRSVLSMCFAICLLFNLLIDYNVEDAADDCRTLAGLTEFFVITTEAWGLMMAADLFSSLMSPFTNYKRQLKWYHFWVWSLGCIYAFITWFLDGAAGYFRVDGQVITSNEKRENLIGFCLASSLRCCSEGAIDCELPACNDSDTSFGNAQQWPWILLYSFVIFVLILSIGVLILAWHRLYYRGVPKTFHIRKRVLYYVSFFTGAYVLYWLVLLGLYSVAYYFASIEATDLLENPNAKSTAAQVLRQLVLFFIASKGYLDYIIWFAVNSIEWNRGQTNVQDGGDVDVDLSPQVNTALRSEILYYTTSGIKKSVELRGSASGRSEQEVYMLGDTLSKRAQKVRFWSYTPHTFRCIREFFGIKDVEYVQKFSATTKERFSEGRSGAFMFYTSDEMFIVKTMSREECLLLRKMAAEYAQYLMSHSRSLLTRFYGCHAVSLYGQTYYFVVMGNLFAETGVIHHRYDIKGSWVDRNAQHPAAGNSVHCRYCNASYTFGSIRNQECSDGLNFHEPNIVLKDNDLLTKIRIDPNQADTLYDQLCSDSRFLYQQGIMDYSLLMGVQSCEYYVEPGSLTATLGEDGIQPPVPQGDGSVNFRTKVATSVNGPALYHFGVIDFLQQWTFEKRAERFYKTRILRKDLDGLSALHPKPYMMRFQQKMAQIFAVSDIDHANHNSYAGESPYRGIQPALIDSVDHRGTIGAMTIETPVLEIDHDAMAVIPLLGD